LGQKGAQTIERRIFTKAIANDHHDRGEKGEIEKMAGALTKGKQATMVKCKQALIVPERIKKKNNKGQATHRKNHHLKKGSTK